MLPPSLPRGLLATGRPSGALLASELLSGPALFVVLLSVVFLLVPCYYLFKALQERGTLERFGIE